MKHLLLLFLFILCITIANSQTIDVTIDYSKVAIISNFHPGVTHTSFSINTGGNDAAMTNAKTLLSSSTYFQNQNLIRWTGSTLTGPWKD